MTELEKMERARMYVEKLANGIDPLTEQPVADGDIVNNVRISRCLFYVSEVLGELISAGGEIKKPKKPKKTEFELPAEKRNEIEISDSPVVVSIIAERINSLTDEETMKKLKPQSINKWLMDAGFLTELTHGTSKTKAPTAYGQRLGIMTEKRTNSRGIEYLSLTYTKEAQQFIIDNLDAVIKFN